MIARHRQRSVQTAVANHLVDHQAKPVALSQTKPARARRKPLDRDHCPSQIHPSCKEIVARKFCQDGFIRGGKVFRVAGKADPSKGSAATAEARPNEKRHETLDIESTRLTGL